MKCSYGECQNPSKARGWCSKHYQRWRKHGDPSVVQPRGPRRDAVTCGTRTSYLNGCRCFPCRLASHRYTVAYLNDGGVRVDAKIVRQQLRELKDAGWSLRRIGLEAGLGNSTTYHVWNRQVSSVNSRTAKAIADLHASLDLEQTVDGTRLAAAIRATGHPVSRLLPDDADRKAFYRAEAGHRLAHHVADRLSVRALGEPLTTFYPVEVA